MTKKPKPTELERRLVRFAQRASERYNADEFASWLRGFARAGENSALLRWKFNKMIREKRS